MSALDGKFSGSWRHALRWAAVCAVVAAAVSFPFQVVCCEVTHGSEAEDSDHHHHLEMGQVAGATPAKLPVSGPGAQVAATPGGLEQGGASPDERFLAGPPAEPSPAPVELYILHLALLV